MNSRERIAKIFAGDITDRCGFWTGNPQQETVEKYLNILSLKTREDLYSYFHDDCRWIPADSAYQHPDGKPAFDPLNGKERKSLNQPGCFVDCNSVTEVEAYDWPNPTFLNFRSVIEEVKKFPDKAAMTGMWTPFFHVVADFFGMSNYFIKMYTDPAIIEAVTDHVVDYYVEANRLFFEQLGDYADIFFMGNDFGTQEDLLISPEKFQQFVLPGLKRNIEIAKKYGKKVLMHSCGAIRKIVPMLIDAGIDGLHPLQAKAKGMDAKGLAHEYKEKIVFVGGVDTQDLLVNGSSEEVKNEVNRLRSLFGPQYIVSPSHEAILPNVPLKNIKAMAEAIFK